MLEIYIYAIPSFILLSYFFYLLRNYNGVHGLATLTLFFTIFAGIIVIIYSLDGIVTKEVQLENGEILYTKFNGEAFVAQNFMENPLIYLLLCVVLTYFLNGFYYRILKLKNPKVLVENKEVDN